MQIKLNYKNSNILYQPRLGNSLHDDALLSPSLLKLYAVIVFRLFCHGSLDLSRDGLFGSVGRAFLLCVALDRTCLL